MSDTIYCYMCGREITESDKGVSVFLRGHVCGDCETEVLAEQEKAMSRYESRLEP